jgi:hypothetical protein
MTGRAIERKTVMPDCIGICFHVSGYARVFFPNFWPFEFVFFNAVGVKALYYALEFGLIEHRHFGLAAPAPEPLHIAKTIT